VAIEGIVATVLGGSFLVAYVVWRWRSATHPPEPETGAHNRARLTFEALRRDPRFEPLQRYLESRYRTTFDSPGDRATYRICYLALINEWGDRLLVPYAGRARYLAAYLWRAEGPTRLQTTLDLKTGAISEMTANTLVWRTIPPLD
jgi:hypothetical protein